MSKWLCAVVGCTMAAQMTLAAPASSEPQWQALQDQDLRVSAGSALDFSKLWPSAVAGSDGWAKVVAGGHIGFERNAAPQRFLAASFVFSRLNGGIPDKAGADLLVAELVRAGYNLARLHFVDAALMDQRDKDFDFDPQALDRLFYLMAAMKKAGIYWLVDGLTSDNAAYGDVRPHRYVKKHTAKVDVLASEAGFEHWAALVEKLWGKKNPYTGTSTLRDPALLGVILVNEGSLAYLATVSGGGYPRAFKPLFTDWLKRRYGDDASLAKAWGGGLSSGESMSLGIDLPKSVRGQSPRDVDFSRFAAERERDVALAMDRHVRTLGFNGLSTAFDNWGFFNADVARAGMGWVDMHSYHALPSQHGQPGSRIEQTSSLANMGRYVRELSNARQWGKPFTVSEYGQPFWNQYRYESPLLVPAVASLQGWDAICQFAETPIQFDYRSTPYARRQAMYPFGVGADPIAHAGERLAALLFRRGDVSEAKSSIRFTLDSSKMLGRTGGWEQVPETLSRLAFVSAVGLAVDAAAMPSSPKTAPVPLAGPPAWVGKLESALLNRGLSLPSDAGLESMKSAGLLPAGNRSNPAKRIYESDTTELWLDGDASLIRLNAVRTVAIAFQGGSAEVGPLRLDHVSGAGLFAVASLDGKPIAHSKRLLAWVLTDAENTGMQFATASRETIVRLGGWPPRARTISAEVRVGLQAAQPMRVWPLSLSGERRPELPSKLANGAISFTLDTGALPNGPALFFEIASN